jgi:MFS family permease
LGSNQSNESSEKHQTAADNQQAPETIIGRKSRYYIIAAALLALFLGALDALVMSAAMPTIIADLGGLHLYSWVYSAYLLARAVSLPIFGHFLYSASWLTFSIPKDCLSSPSAYFYWLRFLRDWLKP